MVECDDKNIIYDTVKEAMHEAGIVTIKKDVTSLLVWRDLLSPIIKYQYLRPWQVINRIPYSNVLCLKIPLSTILTDGLHLFPEFYSKFVPKTFQLPNELNAFVDYFFSQNTCSNAIREIEEEVEEEDYIIKPSNGSLGNGIKIIRTIKNKFLKINKILEENSFDIESITSNKSKESDAMSVVSALPNLSSNDLNQINESKVKSYNSYFLQNLNNEIWAENESEENENENENGNKNTKEFEEITEYEKEKEDILKIINSYQSPAVAQKYISSYLINDTKFDLRIYVLISSISPFEVYVYRNGLARFCSMKSKIKSRYSQLTNVTLNKKAYNAKPEQISQLISDVFEKLEKENNVDIERLWSEIDEIILLTLFTSYRYMKFGESNFVPNYGFPRCFQIFGFDILLGNDLKPYLIEVNYRPSLDFLRGVERRMKVEMLKDSLKIAVLSQKGVQEVVKERKWCWSLFQWQREVVSHPELFKDFKKTKKTALEDSKYVKIWPIKDDSIKKQQLLKVFDSLNELPFDTKLVSC